MELNKMYMDILEGKRAKRREGAPESQEKARNPVRASGGDRPQPHTMAQRKQ